MTTFRSQTSTQGNITTTKMMYELSYTPQLNLSHDSSNPAKKSQNSNKEIQQTSKYNLLDGSVLGKSASFLLLHWLGT
jgi:hypothetical protein